MNYDLLVKTGPTFFCFSFFITEMLLCLFTFYFCGLVMCEETKIKKKPTMSHLKVLLAISIFCSLLAT